MPSPATVYNARMSDAVSQGVDVAAESIGHVSTALNLADHFLIAMPSMADERFSNTVIYVLEHTPERAMGVVINRPTELTLEKLFERVDMKLEIAPLAEQPVCYGGPVATDRGFVLHDQSDAQYGSTLAVENGLSLTTSKDVLEAMASGKGPKHALVALGYSGWDAGQLEAEIALNAWLTVRADPDVVFGVPHAHRRASAMQLLGFDPMMLSGDAGHA